MILYFFETVWQSFVNRNKYLELVQTRQYSTLQNFNRQHLTSDPKKFPAMQKYTHILTINNKPNQIKEVELILIQVFHLQSNHI